VEYRFFRSETCMLTYGILLALCAAGYAGWPWWTVLAGSVALSIYGWRTQLWWLTKPARERWSKKVSAYFVAGIVADIVFSVVAFGLGRAVRIFLG
jgi:hypothetical protein